MGHRSFVKTYSIQNKQIRGLFCKGSPKKQKVYKFQELNWLNEVPNIQMRSCNYLFHHRTQHFDIASNFFKTFTMYLRYYLKPYFTTKPCTTGLQSRNPIKNCILSETYTSELNFCTFTPLVQHGKGSILSNRFTLKGPMDQKVRQLWMQLAASFDK